MLHAIVAVMSAAIVLQATQDVRSLAFEDLTVSPKNLPAGCALVPPPWTGPNGVVVVRGLWTHLPIESNPWAGTDAAIIAAIRERLEPVVIPDGPPLSARDNARFRFKLAEDVETAYAAVYAPSESRPMATVYGLRFTTVNTAENFWRSVRSKTPGAVGLVIGPSVAVVTGDGGECFQAIAAHVRSIVK